MNWYVIASIGVAFLLGWILGTTYGKSKGYAIAIQQSQQRMAQQAMVAQFKSMFQKEATDGTN